jgi:hypothetical protein
MYSALQLDRATTPCLATKVSLGWQPIYVTQDLFEGCGDGIDLLG